MTAIGIDIGGTNIKAVAVQGGVELAKTQVPTPDGDGPALVAGVRQALEQVRRIVSLNDDVCIGVSAPGLPARDGLSIAWMQGRLASVQGLNWGTALGASCPVPVLNDAQAALVGEAAAGAARGERDIILLTLGTGVGGAAMCDGKVLRGHLGRAGHLGHISLDVNAKRDIVLTPGSLEDAIGQCTVGERSHGRFESTERLLSAYRAGDAHAAHVWLHSVWKLACGLTSLINVLDPAVVVLGGGAAAAGDALLDPLAQFLDEIEWRPTGERVRLVPAELGTWAGALGSAHQAIRQRQHAAKQQPSVVTAVPRSDS